MVAITQIVNGPRYTLLLNGKGHKPRLDLSFLSHDFGPCPLWQPGMTAASKPLRLTNHDSQPVAVDPQFSEALMAAGAAAADVWALDLPACVLQPGQSAEGTITFKPGAEAQYALRIPLEVNGLYRVTVDVQGEGVPVRVEPLDASHRAVALGAVSVQVGMGDGSAQCI
jgi:hydrocephalus-inducing protein